MFDIRLRLAGSRGIPCVENSFTLSQQWVGGLAEQRKPAKTPIEPVHLAVDYAILARFTQLCVDIWDPTPSRLPRHCISFVI